MLTARKLEGVCNKPRNLSFHEQALQYCDAHELCFNEGQATNGLGLMYGQCIGKYLKQNRIFSSSWMNVHALHSEMIEAPETSWIYGDTGRSRSQSEMMRHPLNSVKGDLDGHLVAIITEGNRIIRHGTTLAKHSVICQIIALPDGRKSIYTEKFVMAHLRLKDTWIANHSSSVGCFSVHIDITLPTCALK
ncbi:hypothetical protein FGIG_11855 [Fasciola gigantica]|uniref:Uncharacterized protein n=1 Tax=Fasciola gigantica TaxID=46835 RepID=A0A504YRE1_FASGI|nr:hypothetical protein FGIG_11855 [Fasciola gigantica]